MLRANIYLALFMCQALFYNNLCNLITVVMRCGYCFYPHVTDKETSTQSWDWKPGRLTLRLIVSTTLTISPALDMRCFIWPYYLLFASKSRSVTCSTLGTHHGCACTAFQKNCPSSISKNLGAANDHKLGTW